MNRYWEDHPPTHILVAAFMGVKPKKKGKPDIDQMIAEFAGMGFEVK